MQEMSRQRAVLWSVVLSCALTIPWLGRPFHTRGEPREALVAQAMLDTGNWISPPAYDGAVPSKPPFSHWLISLASLPAGEVSEASARLPSALAFIIFSAGFCLFVTRRVSSRVGLASTIVLLASFEWLRAASTCRVDTILATSMAGGMLALFAWWQRGFRGVPWLALLLISISALTKGPVGIVLPVGIFSLFSWIQAGCGPRALVPVVIRGVVLGLLATAVVSVWYILGYLERGDEFIAKIRYENLERFTSSMQDEPHKHSIWYLFGMLFVGLIPWSLFWFCERFETVNSRRVKHLPRLKIREWYHSLPDLYKFSVVASVCVVGFFCIPASKRSVYLLPAFPFLALLLESSLRVWLNVRQPLTRLVSRSLVAVSIVIALSTFALMLVPLGDVSFAFSAFRASLTPLKVLSVGALSGGSIWLLRREVCRFWVEPLNRVGLAVILAMLLGSFFSYDTAAYQLSVREWVRSSEFAAAVGLERRPSFYSFGTEAYGASFYLHKPFARISGTVQPGSLIFVERRKLSELSGVLTSSVVELSHYASGLDKSGRDTVVVEVSQ